MALPRVLDFFRTEKHIEPTALRSDRQAELLRCLLTQTPKSLRSLECHLGIDVRHDLGTLDSRIKKERRQKVLCRAVIAGAAVAVEGRCNVSRLRSNP